MPQWPNGKMDLSTRIKEAIAVTGKTQADIARETGISQSAINQWLSGRTKALKADSAIALEKATGVRAAWIAKGVGPKLLEQSPTVNAPLPVLLVSWKQASIWAFGVNETDADDIQVWVPCPVEHSDFAYALRVQGSSMFNPSGAISFAEGDLLFVDPEAKPKHGSIVIATRSGNEEAIFRQFVVEGSVQYLEALNPAWPERILDIRRSPFTIGGVVLARATILD